MSVYSKAVLIVAPPTLHRQGLVTTLQESWPTIEIVLQPNPAAIPHLVHQQAYAVLVLDCTLITESITTYLQRLRSIRSTQPVLLLSGLRLPPDLRHFLAGVEATHTWLPPHTTPGTVATLFTEYLPACEPEKDQFRAAPRLRLPPTPFSRRELEVLRLVVQDCCNQEIADQLCLSVRTVESHRRALLQKAGAKTLVGLAVRAVQQGWVTA
jgi:DNA-binding NarL/FixJ family response regulator